MVQGVLITIGNRSIGLPAEHWVVIAAGDGNGVGVAQRLPVARPTGQAGTAVASQTGSKAARAECPGAPWSLRNSHLDQGVSGHSVTRQMQHKHVLIPGHATVRGGDPEAPR